MRVSGGLRYRICPDCGEMHDRDAWPDNHRRPGEAVCLPAVHPDGMNALWHPHNGRTYDSKYEFRSVTKASGGQEVGNDVQSKSVSQAKVTKDDVGKAMQMVKQGYRPSVDATASEGWN